MSDNERETKQGAEWFDEAYELLGELLFSNCDKVPDDVCAEFDTCAECRMAVLRRLREAHERACAYEYRLGRRAALDMDGGGTVGGLAEPVPVTFALREELGAYKPERYDDQHVRTKPLDSDGWARACELMDDIDAVHRFLEREYGHLRRERASMAAELERVSSEMEDAESQTVAKAYLDVSPRIDWERMADDLVMFAAVVRGMGHDPEGEDS